MNYSRASGGKLLFLVGSWIQISHFKQMGKINAIKSVNLAAVLVPPYFPLVFNSIACRKKQVTEAKIFETIDKEILFV